MFSPRKTDPFFAALLEIAEHVQEAMHYANDFKVTSVADLKEVSFKLKEYETSGDDLIHKSHIQAQYLIHDTNRAGRYFAIGH